MSGNYTNFAKLTDNEKTAWSLDFWSEVRNWSFFNRFSGSGPNSMVQRISELRASEKGARAIITLVNDLESDGVAGDRTLRGNEEPLKQSDDEIVIDQLRHGNILEGRMADQKSIVNFREQSRDKLAYWMADRLDQLAILTLSGVSYAFGTDGSTRSGSDLPNLDFASLVRAPSSERHFRWDATTGLETGSTGDVAAADTPTWDMLIELKSKAHRSYLRPIRMDGGIEVFNLFMSPEGIAKLKQDEDFKKAYREAMPRTPDNPMFKGTDVIYVDGLAIFNHRHIYNTLGAADGDKWGGGSVDGQRMLLCGAQALGFADIGNPYWEEEYDDYKNQHGISIGKMVGYLKPQFYSIYAGSVQDFGVMAVDTAI